MTFWSYWNPTRDYHCQVSDKLVESPPITPIETGHDMEAMNKLLIALVVLAIIACVTITFLLTENNKVVIHTVEAVSNNVVEKVLEASKNKNMLTANSEHNITTTNSEQNITTTHPYNECIKLFVDQAKESKKACDYEKAKSVCFELLNKNKDK